MPRKFKCYTANPLHPNHGNGDEMADGVITLWPRFRCLGVVNRRDANRHPPVPGRAAAVNLGDWREGVAQVETVTLKAPRHVSHILRRLHGITPIKAMAHALKARGAPFSLRLLGVDLSRIQFESFI
jgi:hypothetical protein